MQKHYPPPQHARDALLVSGDLIYLLLVVSPLISLASFFFFFSLSQLYIFSFPVQWVSDGYISGRSWRASKTLPKSVSLIKRTVRTQIYDLWMYLREKIFVSRSEFLLC
jgi:hypothetical protein